MAAVEITISGVLYDKLNRTSQQVVLVGEGSLTGLGVGGGPIVNPPQPPPQRPVDPGYGYPERPVDPGYGIPGPPYPGRPPGIWGPTDPRPTPPIYLPPDVPPGMRPPEPPKPGDPTTPVPPPSGQAGWPVTPMVVPDYVIINYPGVGPVYVAPPAQPPVAP